MGQLLALPATAEMLLCSLSKAVRAALQVLMVAAGAPMGGMAHRSRFSAVMPVQPPELAVTVTAGPSC